jgi:hypothetical protein
MNGIPAAQDTDVEDVIWALETAEALWNRNERGDAIVWLRRAAQAAGEANDDDRALALAREAAELTEWIARAPSVEVPPLQQTTGSRVTEGSVGGIEIDSLLRSSQIDPSEFVPVASSHDTRPDVPADAAVSTLSRRPPPLPTLGMPSAPPARRESPSGRVLSAAESHAGMLDPWSDSGRASDVGVAPGHAPRAGSERLASSRVPLDVRSPTPSRFEDEVVTSAPIAPDRSSERRTIAGQSVKPPPRWSGSPAAPTPPTPLETKPQEATVPRAPPAKGQEPRPTRAKLVRSRPPFPRPAPTPDPAPTPGPFPEDAPAATPTPGWRVSSLLGTARSDVPKPPPAPNPTSSSEPHAPSTEPQLPPDVSDSEPRVAAAQAASPPPPLVDLSTVEAFADLPEDSRDQLAKDSLLGRYAEGEAIESFALAFVVNGDIHVHAEGALSYATIIGAGAVLRSRGTLEDSIPLRLVCASPTGVVATWSLATVEAALGSCPWVEDDLREAGDRVQALAGASLGALGQRLSPDLRTGILDKLTIRTLAAGETIVMEGVPVPGILLLASGKVDLVADDDSTTEVTAGQFVLPNEALSAGPSPVTARAAAGGALMFVADRRTTQELFATEPLLLELLAGG